MNDNQLKFVIAGHVDHGKSSLIGRLLYDTGSVSKAKIREVEEICQALGKDFELSFLMDHLTEEREKNITIDTTQTFFKTKERDYVIIDAPGHKEFLKNMITGASLAEAAVLIIDAKEGLKEQTKRHAYMLSLLGVKQLIAVINKMDLVDYSQDRFNELKNELSQHLNKLGLKPNYFIPISARAGDNIAEISKNMDWYKDLTVLKALDSFKNKIKFNNLPLRLPVQMVYNDLLLGQVESGSISQDQEVILMPQNIKAKIMEIKKWQADPETAETGDNIGFKLADQALVERGNVICSVETEAKSRKEFTATIFWMSAKPLKENQEFELKLTTQLTKAKIKKIHKIMDSSDLEILNKKEINETEVAEVKIETEKEIIAENFYFIPELGRFVIIKGEDIAGAGTVSN